LFEHLLELLHSFRAAGGDGVIGKPFPSFDDKLQGRVLALSSFGRVFVPVLRTTQPGFRERKAGLHFNAYEIVHVPFEVAQIVFEGLVVVHSKLD
jgi:hypothetical protein